MERKVKVLHIALVLSGVETYIRLVAANIDEAKFELIILRDNEQNQLPITYKSGRVVKTYTLDFERDIRLLKDTKLLGQALKIVKAESPDIIHCHSAKSGITGRTIGAILQIPAFYTPHAFSFLSAGNSLKSFVFKSLERLYSYTNSYVIACSESEGRRAVQDAHYPQERTFVINNSLPRPSQEPVFDNTSNYICTVGRPSYQKNTLYLLQAFREIHKALPALKLYMLGVGHYSPDLEKAKEFIAANNLEHVVRFFEWTSREETLSILSHSLLYISLSRYEGLSYAVLEAMSLGKPCILSDVDGNKDCVADQNSGLLIDIDLPAQESAAAIIDLLRNRDKVTEMGKGAYNEFLRHFIIDKNIQALESLYLQYAK
ncbi:glycosyltransferase [Pontibacter sp. 172403-2]|uniref:glycosyltransferase n=1 Tax=Pontibacter rufus TaxID=2791028 RepID=UPI0018AFB49A|nr:glycosyltransferase [Pontibacter sp. 172403-2]MBF9254971.1 glycosyltransferase [Pontibacter sp. 172403-2]